MTQYDNFEEIQHLQRLLEQYRKNLGYLIDQQAKEGGSSSYSLNLHNQIQASRSAIRKIKHSLRTKYHLKSNDLFIEESDVTQDDQPQEGVQGVAIVRLALDRTLHELFPTIQVIRNQLQSIKDEFEELYKYKYLHDLFQKLEVAYNACDIQYKKGTIVRKSVKWTRLKNSLINLAESEIIPLTEHIERNFLPVDFALYNLRWLADIKLFAASAEDIADRQDIDLLEQLIETLTWTINNVPDRINTFLVLKVNDLHLTTVVQALQTLYNELCQQQHDARLQARFDELCIVSKQIIDELVDLQMLISLHDTFQQVDRHLRETELYLGRGTMQIAGRWKTQQKELDKLCNCGEAWAPKLGELIAKVGDAITKADAAAIDILLPKYRSHFLNSFRRLDKKLLDMCHRFSVSDGPIQRVQKAMMYE